MTNASAAPSAFLLQSGETSKQDGRLKKSFFLDVSSRLGSAKEITSGNGLGSGSCKTGSPAGIPLVDDEVELREFCRA
jgi:hypothetical protein